MTKEEAALIPWMRFAAQFLGVEEIPGQASNPVILGWAQRASAWIKAYFTNDDVPWCALFVNTCLSEGGFQGTNSLAARSFLNWGFKCQPTYGAVMVFHRQGGGHVGFYLGETDAHYLIRGGNQGNRVSDMWIAKDRLLEARWPVAVAPERRVQLRKDGKPVSSNEA